MEKILAFYRDLLNAVRSKDRKSMALLIRSVSDYDASQVIKNRKPSEPITDSEFSVIIKHQLKYAGAIHDIFTEESISIIHASSSGIARKIDKICTSCLFYGEQKKISVIDGNIVKEIVELEFA